MPDKLHYYCKDCLAKQREIRFAAQRAAARSRKTEPKTKKLYVPFTPEKKAQQRRWYLWRKYRISEADYDEALRRQNGLCAICKSPEPGGRRECFVVDHDHESGQVRGLLCIKCNIGIGFFKDNTDVMLSAIAYLAEWKEVEQPVDKPIVTV
jgi:hypothetical protein